MPAGLDEGQSSLRNSGRRWIESRDLLLRDLSRVVLAGLALAWLMPAKAQECFRLR